MSSAAWGSRHCGPCLHCDSRVAVRRSRVQCPRIQGVLAPVEPSTRSLVHSNPYPVGDDASLQRGGLLQALRTGMASAGQLLRLSSRDNAVASSQRSFKDVERLRELGGEATERGLQAQSAAEEKAGAVKAPPADIRHYLKPTGLMETRYIRMLSSLCNETYYLSRLSKRTLRLRHKLELVTTSHECAHVAKEIPRTAAQTMEDGDAMASTPQQAETAQRNILESSHNAVPAMEALTKLKHQDTKREKSWSPTEIVAQRLSAAAAAAAHAAAPLANNITSFTSAAASAVPMKAMTSQLQVAAAAGQSTAVATIATVTAAVQSTWGGDKSRLTKDKLHNPTEWYVADDLMSRTRYFIIQGSDTLDHWKVNLTFDPVIFEDPSLGVKVHRGVYEAAKLLYERYKPMVEEHLATSPFAKVSFTGHSLGGSLGSLLMLMFLHRGVIPISAISPTYTFGAPAIFCEASGPGGTCALAASAAPKALPAGGQPSAARVVSPDASPKEAAASSAQNKVRSPVMDRPEVADRSLLERLGLPTGAIRNIIMHRDIVPRAFACDYKLVADILARVNDGFREHGCLQNTEGRQVMYYFLGKMFVLQPDDGHSFVREPDHPMLPSGPGLYTLQEPSKLASGARNVRSAAAAQLAGHAAELARLARKGTTHLGNISPKPASIGKPQAGSLALFNGKPKAEQAPATGPPAATLFEAIMELLDFPHPLDMLSEVTAYGPDGTISRYHNPANYTRALGGVLRSRRNAWRPLLGGPSLADALGKQQIAAGTGPSPGMAANGLWFNPRTGTQKVKVRRVGAA